MLSEAGLGLNSTRMEDSSECQGCRLVWAKQLQKMMSTVPYDSHGNYMDVPMKVINSAHWMFLQ